MYTGNNLTGVAVQFAAQDQKKWHTSSKMYSNVNIKICYYVVLFIPISSKVEFFAMQNFESNLFPACISLYRVYYSYASETLRAPIYYMCTPSLVISTSLILQYLSVGSVACQNRHLHKMLHWLHSIPELC